MNHTKKIKHITIVVGARPNFMKISPIIEEINKRSKITGHIGFSLVHTGQHYDNEMSDNFFVDLNIPRPDAFLGCKGETHAKLTASIIVEFESYLINNNTDLVLVVGDVTSTMACALAAAKLNIKVAHVEAGIRSNDWSMPEEINRLVTDSITSYFFTTSRISTRYLIDSGVSPQNICFAGNTMIDTLINNYSRLKSPSFWDYYKLDAKKYILLTLHRPSNVDDLVVLKLIIEKILEFSDGFPIIFSIHPRTKQKFSLLNINSDNLILVDPMRYHEFNFLVKNSLFVITDSGGVSEETTYLKIPCLTMRSTTERPETVLEGSNLLIGNDFSLLKTSFNDIFNGIYKKSSIPENWDGNASKRIVDFLEQILIK
jgi:UDP-N-acetylglucosamine 2-epimerase (non-hydrolysing)